MNSTSPKLDQFLKQILSDEETPSPSDDEYDDSNSDGGSSDSGVGPRRIWYFPTDETYNEYLAVVGHRPDGETRRVIRRLLIPSGAIGADRLTLDTYLAIRNRREATDDAEEFRLNWLNSDYVQRVVRYFGGETDDPPWEGITWVLNLLPNHPRSALSVLDTYFQANPQMTDNMIHAISDAEGIIRARYIGLPESSGGRLVTLREITWREFEQLVEHLYAEKGYRTELTRPTHDGGRDIIAELSGPGMQERILISCKQSRKNIGVSDVRDLDSVTTRQFANKGTLVTNSDFTRPAREEFAGNSRIELINGPELVVLLNEYLGWTWPARIEYYTRKRPFGAAGRRS
jgi:restriction system protein